MPAETNAPRTAFQPVQPYARLRISNVVAGQVRGMVSTGALTPGQRLPAERELADLLAVSRPSLREALVRLEADGFLRSEGRGGFVVTDLTAPMVADPLAALLARQPEAAADMLELRRDLESLATGYAAERAGKAELRRIADAFAALEEATADPGRGHLAERDAAFHRVIAEAAHNFALTQVMHGLQRLVRQSILTSQRLVDYDAAIEAKLMAQHRAIFSAIEEGRPKRARKAAAAHLDYVATLYPQLPPGPAHEPAPAAY